MRRGVTVKMSGFKELERALGDLKVTTARNIARRGLKEALEPVAEAARARVPSLSGDLAESITVTTKNLRGAFQNIKGITSDIRVIPNAIDDYLFPEPKAPRQAPNKIIAWRGGNSHAQDLAIVKDDVRKLVELGYRFVFFGMKPHVLEPVLPLGTWSHIEWNGEVDTFLRKLSDLNASFHMVPLENNDLNKAKSNIAWLEASWHGGSACVVSDIESDEWVDAMETEGIADTILTLTFGATEVVRSQRVIRDYFLLSAINNQRAKLVRELMEMK